MGIWVWLGSVAVPMCRFSVHLICFIFAVGLSQCFFLFFQLDYITRRTLCFPPIPSGLYLMTCSMGVCSYNCLSFVIKNYSIKSTEQERERKIASGESCFYVSSVRTALIKDQVLLRRKRTCWPHYCHKVIRGAYGLLWRLADKYRSVNLIKSKQCFLLAELGKLVWVIGYRTKEQRSHH